MSSSSSSTINKQHNRILLEAPPPWHSVMLNFCVWGYLTMKLPTIESLDEVATIEMLSNRIFPTLISFTMLGLIRLFFALCIWAVTVKLIYFSDGYTVTSKYLKQSKLLSGVKIRLNKYRTMYAYTGWAWLLLGLSFTFLSIVPLGVAFGFEDFFNQNKWFLRLTFILWEISASMAPFVTVVVRYALWPMALKRGFSTEGLRTIQTLMAHNANSFFVLTELALLGGLPIRQQDYSVSPLLGVIYGIFTWMMASYWTKPEFGPQFIYFFSDTTLGWLGTFNLIILLLIQLLFYMLLVTIEHFVTIFSFGASDPSLLCRMLYVTVILASICRFRD